MKICLTANSGGHLNEILQIRKFLKNHDVFYITDKTKMTEAIKKHEKVYFVQKFIIRELIRKLKIIAPILNLLQSMKIYFKEKPNLIITTGAGTSFGIWLVGKVLG
ncbi:MAG: hypothetical protein HOJ35_03870, partial [Bdellovibrionales bacterium]|nr:hypothetical protein [Bdellovibrionales bacterium]